MFLTCLSNIKSLIFEGYGVEKVLVEKPGVGELQEGHIILLDKQYSTPLYTLKEPFRVVNRSDSFYLQYISMSETVLELYFGDGAKKELKLPYSGDIIRYQVPVSRGNLISGFRVRAANTEKENKNFRILKVGIEKTNSGLSIINSDGNSVLVIRKGFKIAGPDTFLFDELSTGSAKGFNQVRVSLTYEYTGDDKSDQEIVLFSDTHKKSFRLNPRRGGAEIYFYSKSLDFLPAGITVKNSDPGFKVIKIEISPFSTLAPVNYSPVPADIGTILRYQQSAWRRSDWELFSWNLFPHILVLDFRDYTLQSAFLKRLAFFLEKSGFTGKLLDNDTLSKLHGWNAHDYRAEDIAAFFNAALESNFKLNPEEYEFRDILLKNNIIIKTDNGYSPLTGGILSFSMESTPRLRYLFLTHEGYHGIYFSDMKYDSKVQAIWDSLEEPEKQFWYDFLDWKHYEIKDPYLVVNEFQAYLMQQKISNINSYYKEYIIPKYLVLFPDKTEEMNSFLLNYPDHFINNAKKVEEAVFGLDTIRSGELRCLY